MRPSLSLLNRAISFFVLFFFVHTTLFSQRVAPFAYSTGTPVNYVRTWDVKVPESNSSNLSVSTTSDKAVMTTQYLDGLGRPIQTVVKGITPLGKDLVTPVIYDAFGREEVKYLPFAANTTGGNTSVSNGGFKLNPFQQDSAFSKAQYPGESHFYSQVMFEASPLGRVQESFAPGDSWAGTAGQSSAANRRSVKTSYLINTVSDSVRIWTASSTVSTAPTTTTIYGAGELYKTVTTDEQGKQVVEYKDKEGKVVLKKVQLAATPGTAHVGWLCTYYVYNDLGQLRFVLQPQALALLLAAGNWTLTTTHRDELCFYYGYDGRGRMNIKKVPGAGEVHLVYDGRDRLVMTQDANQRNTSKWLVTLYDTLNRPFQTGLYNSATTRVTHQAAADNLPGAAYPFTTNTAPSSGWELLTETGYDSYAGMPTGTPTSTLDGSYINGTNFFTTYNAAPDYAQPISQSFQTKGLVTWTRVKVLGTAADFLHTVTLYDEKGRVIQVKSTNVSGGTDVATTQYDFSGKVLRTHVKHQKSGSQANIYQVLTKMGYDAAGRVLTVKKRVNNNTSGNTTDKTVMSNSYDELGQLKTKALGTNPLNTSTALENLTYDYNIRGWMLGLNRAYLKNNNAAGFEQRYFGFELGYDKSATTPGTTGFGYVQYNGNIAGVIWKSRGDEVRRYFDYLYDNANRLGRANYYQYVSPGSNDFWNPSDASFSVHGNDPAYGNAPTGNNNYISYDANGNILGMVQHGFKLSNPNTIIDQLQYTYFPQSNKLQYVTDAITADQKLGDFTDKNPGTTDYTYDDNGNLVKDLNKDLVSYTGANGIVYNHLNLPQSITVKANGSSNKGTIQYVYDAAGTKLKKITTEGSKVTTTLYMLGTYQNDTLQFLPHEEGRIRPTQNTQTPFVYDYMLKDHLGNVRIVLTEEQQTSYYPAATLEGSQTSGALSMLNWEKEFYSVDNTKIVAKSSIASWTTSNDYPNHNGNPPYNSVASGSYPANYTVSDGVTSANVYKLNATANKTGLGVMIKVMAGDVVNIFGKSYFYAPSTSFTNSNSTALTLSNIFTSLLGTPGNVAASKGLTDPQLQTLNSGSYSVPSSFIRGGDGTISSSPKAYINYLFFDEQFRFAGGNASRVGSSGTVKSHWDDASMKNIAAPKSGYLYVYVSNESNIDVFFDNLQIVHNRGPILEETHYYPFGLTMAGISSKAASFGQPENKKKYNGIELENDFEIQTYDAQFRELDPQIARWWQIDPVTDGYEHISPYASMYNNPVTISDPLGNEGEACCEGLIGTFIELYSKYQEFTNRGPSGEQMKEGIGQVFSSTAGALNGTLHYGTFGAWPLNPAQAFFGSDGMNEAQSETYYAATDVAKVAGPPVLISPAGGGANITTTFEHVPAAQFKLTTSYSTGVNLSLSKALSTGLGNPFKNKTPSEVNAAMQEQVKKGKVVEKYTDPVSGSKAYQNTKSKYSYNVDTGKSGKTGGKVEPAHVDVNYPNPKPKNVPPKKKLPIKEEN
ncbi:MAG TPA: DUF6443 domain-containing protein [Flavisolibacter sp.]|jgi:RHS repeat-associated protein|nr:DUF6443 domain-containing protein [Flavisolibacter sp.]